MELSIEELVQIDSISLGSRSSLQLLNSILFPPTSTSAKYAKLEFWVDELLECLLYGPSLHCAFRIGSVIAHLESGAHRSSLVSISPLAVSTEKKKHNESTGSSLSPSSPLLRSSVFGDRREEESSEEGKAAHGTDADDGDEDDDDDEGNKAEEIKGEEEKMNKEKDSRGSSIKGLTFPFVIYFFYTSSSPASNVSTTTTTTTTTTILDTALQHANESDSRINPSFQTLSSILQSFQGC